MPGTKQGSAEQGDLPHVARGESSIEWYTPSWILDGVRAVLGRIDTDPASSVAAQMVVQATTYHTAEDDGLAHHWFGKCFMNPPYARYIVDAWAYKWMEEWEAGNIVEGCVLCNNATETLWFQRLIKGASALCMIKSRVRFWSPDSESNKGLQGQILLYFGVNAPHFMRVWETHGSVAIPAHCVHVHMVMPDKYMRVTQKLGPGKPLSPTPTQQFGTTNLD